MPEIKRKPMKLIKEDGEALFVFDENHTLADVVRWLMDNRTNAEEARYLLKEALGKLGDGQDGVSKEIAALADAVASLRQRFSVANAIGGNAVWNAKGSGAASQILMDAEKVIRQCAMEAQRISSKTVNLKEMKK